MNHTDLDARRMIRSDVAYRWGEFSRLDERWIVKTYMVKTFVCFNKLSVSAIFTSDVKEFLIGLRNNNIFKIWAELVG